MTNCNLFRLQSSHVDFAVISSGAEVGKAIAVLTVTDEDGPIGGEYKAQVYEPCRRSP